MSEEGNCAGLEAGRGSGLGEGSLVAGITQAVIPAGLLLANFSPDGERAVPGLFESTFPLRKILIPDK